MVYRPRDICSAAFFNDLPRLRLLLHQDAPGGLEYRFNLERFLAHVNANANANANANGANGVPPPTSAPPAYDGVEDEEEEETEFDNDLEAALEADTELERLRKLYTLEEEDIDDDDAAAAAEEAEAGTGGSEEDGLYDPDVVEAEMTAQEADFARFKRLLRHQAREKALAATLHKHGLLVSGDSPAELQSYGVMFTSRELSSEQRQRQGHGAEEEAEVEVEEEKTSHVTPLAVRWLPSRVSPYVAGPLHWAALGRAHDAIRFLVANGVDAADEVGLGEERRKYGEGCGAFVFPPGLTAERLASMNESAETVRVLRAAVADREEYLRSLERAKQQVEGSLEQRKARQEKRRLGREQRRVAREERNAAAEEEEDDGVDDNEEGNHSNNNADDETDNEGDY